MLYVTPIIENMKDTFIEKLQAITATEPKRTKRYRYASSILRNLGAEMSHEARQPSKYLESTYATITPPYTPTKSKFALGSKLKSLVLQLIP